MNVFVFMLDFKKILLTIIDVINATFFFYAGPLEQKMEKDLIDLCESFYDS